MGVFFLGACRSCRVSICPSDVQTQCGSELWQFYGKPILVVKKRYMINDKKNLYNTCTYIYIYVNITYQDTTYSHSCHFHFLSMKVPPCPPVQSTSSHWNSAPRDASYPNISYRWIDLGVLVYNI